MPSTQNQILETTIFLNERKKGKEGRKKYKQAQRYLKPRETRLLDSFGTRK